MILSGVDLTPEASGKTLTIDVANVSLMTDMQHAMGTLRYKNGFQTLAEINCCTYQDHQEHDSAELKDSDMLFSKGRRMRQKLW